jgi:transposase
MLPASISVKGIDLHTNRFNVSHLTTKDGSEKRATYDIRTDLDEFLKTLDPEDVVVMEASTNSFAFAHLISPRVKKVHVVNAMDFRIIHDTKKKTDRIDALKLARGGHYHECVDPHHLPLVTVPDEKIMELRSLFTTYKKVTSHITAILNRIHSILKGCLKPYNDENIQSKRIRTEIRELDIKIAYKLQIQMLYDELDLLAKHKESLAEAITEYARYYIEEIKLIISIPGISILIALALKADYIDISRFANQKKFCSYLRTAPKVDRSNNTTRILGINKNSRKLSLSLLMQGLSHFCRNNAGLTAYRKSKLKGKHIAKVRIIIARKLLTILYFMLKRKELYRDRDPYTYSKKLEVLEKLSKAA